MSLQSLWKIRLRKFVVGSISVIFPQEVQHYNRQPSPASSSTAPSFPQRPPSSSQAQKSSSRLVSRQGFRHDHASKREIRRGCFSRTLGCLSQCPHVYFAPGRGESKYGDMLNTPLTGAFNLENDVSARERIGFSRSF